MRNVWTLAKKEWRQYFISARAYVIGAVFLLVAGYFFSFAALAFNQMCQIYSANPAYAPYLSELNLNEMVIRGFLGNLTVVFLFIIPALTMRSFAGERREGTMELLLTSPIRDWELVLGKYAGAFLSVASILAATLLYPLILSFYGSLDWGALLTGYLGVFLTTGAFVSVGILASSLTKNQVIAMVLTFGVLLLFYVMGWSAESSHGASSEVLRHLALMEHVENFSKGVIEVKDIVYLLSVTALMLFITHRVLDSRRWRG